MEDHFEDMADVAMSALSGLFRASHKALEIYDSLPEVEKDRLEEEAIEFLGHKMAFDDIYKSLLATFEEGVKQEDRAVIATEFYDKSQPYLLGMHPFVMKMESVEILRARASATKEKPN